MTQIVRVVGIGRRSPLKMGRRKAWGFESPRGHD